MLQNNHINLYFSYVVIRYNYGKRIGLESFDMNERDYDVTGIMPLSSYPEWCHQNVSNEFCETDTLCLPCNQFPVESLVSIHVSISICSFDTISTFHGKKVFIEGIKHIKILYVAEEECQSVHSVNFDVPFCFYIVVGCICCEITDVFAAVEDVRASIVDCKCISVSVLVNICAKKKSHMQNLSMPAKM